MAEDYDVVIVGGGLGGLAAAHLLLKQKSDVRIKVIEASDRVCSALKTVELESADGKDVYDIGATRIGSALKLTLDLLKDFGIETYPHFDKGTKHWQLADGKVKSYSGAIPPMAYTALADVLRYFRKMDKIAEKINLNDITSTENCAEYDNTNMEAFINKFLFLQGAKELAATMVGTFCGLPASEVNLLHYGAIIKSCGNWDKHMGGDGTGRMDLQVKGGLQQVGERLRDSIGEDRITLSDPVTSIQQPELGKSVTVQTKSGKSYSAKRAIVAIPSADICKIDISPALPVPRNLTVGSHNIHCVMTYKKFFWREKKLAAELLSMSATLGGFKNEEQYPLIAFFDHSSAKGNPALMGVFSPSSYYKNMTSAERKAIAVDFIASVLGDEARDIIDYADYDWSKRTAEGTKPTLSTEVKPSQVLDSLTKPHGSVHFAGEETGLVWSGMMECALDASHRAVKEVMQFI